MKDGCSSALGIEHVWNSTRPSLHFPSSTGLTLLVEQGHPSWPARAYPPSPPASSTTQRSSPSSLTSLNSVVLPGRPFRHIVPVCDPTSCLLIFFTVNKPGARIFIFGRDSAQRLACGGYTPRVDSGAGGWLCDWPVVVNIPNVGAGCGGSSKNGVMATRREVRAASSTRL